MLDARRISNRQRNRPSLDVTELAQVLSGAHVGRTCDDEGTVVDLTGIAAQDIVITQAIIEPPRRKTLSKQYSRNTV
ncbi:MAG TPA: hypothetical protein EYQ14_12705 [Gammaproteobacteria bacterium]|nr:hypothetical protein [Gammaproteobacteria bacterium]HIM04781.1 hypothetical protein [Gammaproteobacteria bacterium]